MSGGTCTGGKGWARRTERARGHVTSLVVSVGMILFCCVESQAAAHARGRDRLYPPSAVRTAPARHELWFKENRVYHRSGVESLVRHKPVFADLDADGDFDMAIGEEEGRIAYYENIGDETEPVWEERISFFAEIGVDTLGYWIAPAFADLDGDGDEDLVIGTQLGDLFYIENVGTPSLPSWASPDTILFGNVQIGSFASVPTFADLDADGDLDLVLGERDPVVHYYENVGDSTQALWAEDPSILSGLYFGYFAAPALGDLDGDGDSDLVVGRRGGDLYYYYENTGTPSEPEWILDTGMFAGIHVGWHSAPFLVDLDGDLDLDLVVGEEEGTLNLYSNAGTPYEAAWEADTSGFAGIDVGFWSAPFLCDLDGDGDFDLVVGEEKGGLAFYRNEREGASFRWVLDSSVFAGIEAGTFIAPALGDLDGDGDFDLVIGDLEGVLHSFENTGTAQNPVWSPGAGLVPEIDVGADACPRLVDGDGDEDLDLAVGSWDEGLFYFENVGSATSPAWQEVPGIFAAVDSALRSAPAFFDPDEDDDMDLVVGEWRGFFHYYENVSTGGAPVWIAGAPLFEGIDVGSYSIPAFADIDGDGDEDLTYGEYAGNVGAYLNTTYTPVDPEEHLSLRVAHGRGCIWKSYPNPFGEATTIVFSCGDRPEASLEIYDVLGRLVRELGLGSSGSGLRAVEWDGRDREGRQAASGVYLVRLRAERASAAHKILLLR